MGKILNGILGGVSGKVGGVIGAAWKGIDYLKAYNVPANPRSVLQTAQRDTFTTIVWIARLLLGTVITDYWEPFAVKMSGFNSFMRRNLLRFTNSTDYANLLIAEGSLESDIIATSAYGGDTVVTTWDGAILGNGAIDDHAVTVIIDVVNKVAFVDDTTITRVDEMSEVTVGSGRTVGNLKAYLFFYRGSGESLMVSNSDYFQVTT